MRDKTNQLKLTGPNFFVLAAIARGIFRNFGTDV